MIHEAKAMDAAHNQLCSDEYKMECDDVQQTEDVVELHETFLKYFQHTVDTQASICFYVLGYTNNFVVG